MQEVAMLPCANRSQTIDKIAAAAGINHGTCHKILSDDMNMLHVTQHSIPRVLTQDQRDDHMGIAVTCSIVLYQRWQTCKAANGDYFEGGCGYV
jgi:hypothetical protein